MFYYIIVNPVSRSGRGKKCWHQIAGALTRKRIAYQVYFSRHPGNTIELTRKIMKTAKQFPIRLLIVGGDGTVNEAIQGISDFEKIQLSYIPTGSSNDLARDLNLAKDPLEYLEHILTGQVHRMDIGMLHYENATLAGRPYTVPDRYFAVACGIGFDAAVCEEALHSKCKDLLNRYGLGKLTYLFIALKQLLTVKPVSCEFYVDDYGPFKVSRLLFLSGMIHRYEGGGFCFCPNANARDGFLDICCAADMSKARMLMALPHTFKGTHFSFPGINEYRGERIRIKTSSPLWVQTDGEVKARSDSIELYCLKQKLQFVY